MTMHEQFESLAALDALGVADEEERRQLRAHLVTCVDCRRARDEMAEAATAIGRGLDPVAPPSSLRAAVIDRVRPRHVIDDRWWLAAAAALLVAMLGWREMAVRSARAIIDARNAEIRSLATQNDLLARRTERLNAEVAALASKDTRVIALAGQQVAPSASARVFLEPSKRRAVVFFANLPANATDKSYQLWIIRADQPKPQSAGVFDVTPNGTASISVENLPVETEIKAMAVTLEPRGGVEQPTNTNFYLAGKS